MKKTAFIMLPCYLPQYRWEDVFGFSEEEMARYREVIESTAHLIVEFSKEGGFDHAAGF